MEKQKLLKVDNLKKKYNKKVVLDIDSLCFEKDNVYVIVGPNGSGNTTLINILNLLEKFDEGQLFFKDNNINDSNGFELLKIRRQMTLVHQKPILFQTTVSNNVSYGLKIRGLSTVNQEKRIKNALKMVGLSGFEKKGCTSTVRR
ncbi:MAG: ATP-binding cassette domain-containing protein [Atribacterota bacterium]